MLAGTGRRWRSCWPAERRGPAAEIRRPLGRARQTAQRPGGRRQALASRSRGSDPQSVQLTSRSVVLTWWAGTCRRTASAEGKGPRAAGHRLALHWAKGDGDGRAEQRRPAAWLLGILDQTAWQVRSAGGYEASQAAATESGQLWPSPEPDGSSMPAYTQPIGLPAARLHRAWLRPARPGYGPARRLSSQAGYGQPGYGQPGYSQPGGAGRVPGGGPPRPRACPARVSLAPASRAPGSRVTASRRRLRPARLRRSPATGSPAATGLAAVSVSYPAAATASHPAAIALPPAGYGQPPRTGAAAAGGYRRRLPRRRGGRRYRRRPGRCLAGQRQLVVHQLGQAVRRLGQQAVPTATGQRRHGHQQLRLGQSRRSAAPREGRQTGHAGPRRHHEQPEVRRQRCRRRGHRHDHQQVTAWC